MTCRDCTQAKTRLWHGYQAACPDCIVRQLAMSPKSYREAAYDEAESHRGIEARREIVRRVKEEMERIRALRDNNQNQKGSRR